MNNTLIIAGLLAGSALNCMGQLKESSTIPTSGTAEQTNVSNPGKNRLLRIGVLHPAVQMAAAGSTPETLEHLVTGYLSSPHVQIVPISARLPQQVQDELSAQNCDLALSVSLTEKKGGNGLAFLKGASSMASMIPMVGMAGGLAGAAASAAARTALSGAGAVAGSVKAKSEYTVKYSLLRISDQKVLKANAMQAKAKQDGEDVITPAIEQMATEVLAQAALTPKVQP